MLLDIDGRRLASGTDDDNGIGPFTHVEVDQIAQGIQIEAAILVHWSDDGDNGSGNHGLLSKKIIL